MKNPLTPVIAVFYLLLVGAALVWAYFLTDFRLRFLHGEDPALWLRHGAMGLACGILVIVLTKLATDNFNWAKGLENEFRDILGPFDPPEILFLALASGFAEEIFFRGVMQEVIGLTAASLIFGLLHVGPTLRYLPWTIYAIGAGFLLGLLYERAGLFPVILAHSLVNFVSLTRINRRRRQEMFLE